MSVRVLLIDDHELTRAGVRLVIDNAEDLQVVAEAANCVAAARSIREDAPDVIVLDLSLPDGEGLDLIEVAREHAPSARLLALSAHYSHEWVERAIQAGCDGYLDKGAGMTEIASAIRAVHSGRTVINITSSGAAIFKDSSHATVPAAPAMAHESLSERESEVLRCIAQGLTNQQAADRMFLSVKTVETYRSRLMRKLGLRSRSALFDYAKTSGLLA